MVIEQRSSETVDVDYDELCGALAARDMQGMWSMQTRLMRDVPLPTTLPWLWTWETIYAHAKRAGEVVTIERGGDRRVLALANPGLGGLPYTSTTLWGAVQYLGPRESAPAHRHSPSAIRFVMSGSGAFTTVNGDACDMLAGDLILTPNWNWHDHNNETDAPMVWFDGLDLPMVANLEAIFFENHPDLNQSIRGRNLSQTMFQSTGVRSTEAVAIDGQSPLLRYPRIDTDRALSVLGATRDGHSVSIEYRDPMTGGPVSTTFACEMTRLYPGGRTATTRKTGSTIFVVFSGQGRTVINGQAFDWGAGDIFVTPSWSAVDHEAMTEADLFAISDRAVLESLRLYRHETLSESQEITANFAPR